MTRVGLEPGATLYEITERYPATLPVLIDSGFAKLADPELRARQGKALTLEAAAKLKSLSIEALTERLDEAVRSELGRQDPTLAEDQRELSLRPAGDVCISGLLPCPVRLPILEAVESLAQTLAAEDGTKLGSSLAAAAVGADALIAQLMRVEDETELPDVFVSAGFETFFDHRTLERFKQVGVFTDVAPPDTHRDFSGLSLRDPEGHFTLIAVVPAVFVINHTVLDGAAAPRSFEELLEPRFAQKVALPVGDFDLFNALLLQLQQRYGADAVDALATNMIAALHPSQTVGRFAGKQQARPAISVVPWFFSRMTFGTKHMETVWPADGAVLSPIFALVRRRGHRHARRVGELFASKEIGEVLAHKGLFPALHPEVDNRLPPGASFQWLGWDFIREHDLGRLLPEVRGRFDRLVEAASATIDGEGAASSDLVDGERR